MAYEELLQSVSLDAASDLSGSQYRFVIVTAEHTIGSPAASGDKVLGVLQNKPDGSVVNEAATVGVLGISKVEAGGAVSAGDEVTTDANGKAITAASGNNIAGVALAAGADTEVVPVLLQYRGTAA